MVDQQDQHGMEAVSTSTYGIESAASYTENGTEEDLYRLEMIAYYEAMRPYTNIAMQIWDLGSPIVGAFGVFGNTMINVIMLRLPASTSSIFFHILAISDQVVLILSPLSDFFSTVFDKPMPSQLSSGHCKLYYFGVYLSSFLSPWMLVALTALRAASVLWPLRVNATWTVKKSRVTAAALTSAITGLHLHVLYGYDTGDACGGTNRRCCEYVVSDAYFWFDEEVWPWVNIVGCCFLPFTLLFVSNGVLIRTLVRSVREMKTLPGQQQRNTQESRQRKASSLTVVLVVTSACFFFLTTPIQIFILSSAYVDYDNPIIAGQYRIFRAASNNVWYINSAINFYLYFLTGTKFRAEFTNMIFQVVSICFYKRRAAKAKG